MSLTNEQLVGLHQKATHLLTLKLAKFPARVFPSGRKPTIVDIYASAESIYIPTIPPALQLPFLLTNYNKFAAAGFHAGKREQDLNVSMAIFHWQMDQQHSFSSHHKEIRFNVLLAHIVLQTPDARKHIDPELERFLTCFIWAWLETAMRVDYNGAEQRDFWVAKCWKVGKYELVTWGKQARGRMGDAVKKLEACVPPQSCAADDFWDRASAMPIQEYKEHGPAWAMQFIIYKERQSKLVDKETRDEDAEESLQSGGFLEVFGNLGVGDAVPGYLSKELFGQPLVQALLTEVDQSVGVQQPEHNNCWMDPLKAIELIEGRVEGLEDVAERIRGMSFLGAQ